MNNQNAIHSFLINRRRELVTELHAIDQLINKANEEVSIPKIGLRKRNGSDETMQSTRKRSVTVTSRKRVKYVRVNSKMHKLRTRIIEAIETMPKNSSVNIEELKKAVNLNAKEKATFHNALLEVREQNPEMIKHAGARGEYLILGKVG